MRATLSSMPYDKMFLTANGNELCHATGDEVCFGDPADGANWWNEYEDSEGNLYYGR